MQSAKSFWTKANTSNKGKIQVFNAIIRSKVLFGLECIQLTGAEISKLNAFQNKSLQRIPGKPPTFLDRVQTNERVYREIRQTYQCKFEHFGETWRKPKLKLFGHILRSSSSDPLNQIMLHADNIRPRAVLTRRMGRPSLIGCWRHMLMHISAWKDPSTCSILRILHIWRRSNDRLFNAGQPRLSAFSR